MSNFVDKYQFGKRVVDLDSRTEQLVTLKYPSASDETDERYVQLLKFLEAADLITEALLIHDEDDVELIDEIEDPVDYVDDLVTEVKTAVKIVNHAHRNPEIKRDLNELPTRLLREARGLDHVGRHLGIEVSLPDPSEVTDG